MKSDIVRRLVDLNRAFYQTFAAPFAATRERIQPGVKRLLEGIPSAAAVADLGCGNGNAAVFLAAHNPPSRYLGIDLSQALLDIARAGQYPFQAEFRLANFSEEDWDLSLPYPPFDFILAFAVMHHIPGIAGRLAFLGACRRLLAPGGKLFFSNWQFLRSAKLRARTLAWSEIGLTESGVEEGDYLMDWRREGRGLRYIHVLGTQERLALAQQAGFTETECFESDGEGGKLADYAVWGRS